MQPTLTPVLTREQAPIEDNERSTAMTVRRMSQLVQASQGDIAMRQAADQIRRAAGFRPTEADFAQKCFWWIRARVKFRSDDSLIARFFGERDQLELLIEPKLLIRARKPEGDCDDFTMLCCALLNALGIPNHIVTVKADQPEPDRWSHVYCAANVGGREMTLDCSHGDCPGWEVPYFYAKRYWSSLDGSILRDVGARLPAPSLPQRRVA